MGPTTALHPPQLQQLRSKEATSKPFTPKPHHLSPHNRNGRLRQLQLLLLELLLRSGLLHLRQISKSFHQPTFGNIIRQHHNVTASPRRSPSSSTGENVSGMRQYSRGTANCLREWIGGQIDEDTILKMEGKEHGLQQCTFASTCYS